jgi:hypothetical protein
MPELSGSSGLSRQNEVLRELLRQPAQTDGARNTGQRDVLQKKELAQNRGETGRMIQKGYGNKKGWE